ncbi:DNA-directed RNA polymerase II subunit 1-like, partial [Limulus polyphemus]|uniref:DNA-directed RNA polymerase II subunit 1-like n=1 Tax=Limulus polyphemus TaxID=6850 RepID=A0ABM1TJT2_LIMPO
MYCSEKFGNGIECFKNYYNHFQSAYQTYPKKEATGSISQITSPIGQIPAQSYHPGFGPYDRTPSPGPARNCEAYPQPGGQGLFNYGYQDYPAQPPSPPSGASESPPPHRSMAQNLHPAQPEYNHRPLGYDELRSSMLAPSRGGYQDKYGSYGYSGAHLNPTSPGYTSYETASPPQGYLDRRPSYDDRPPSQGTPNHLPCLYSTVPRAAFQEGEEKSLPPQVHHPPPHQQPPVEYETEDVRWRDPDLHEVIEFLGHPNNVIQANAAGYLQHLCYNDDHMKQKT